MLTISCPYCYFTHSIASDKPEYNGAWFYCRSCHLLWQWVEGRARTFQEVRELIAKDSMTSNSLDPYYCTRCKGLITKSTSLHQRICDNCLESILANAINNEREKEELNRLGKERIYNKDTHRGVCSACGSRNIEDKVTEVKIGGGGSGWQAAAGLAGCFIWPLLFLIPFLGDKKAKHHSRVCKACGHQWPI